MSYITNSCRASVLLGSGHVQKGAGIFLGPRRSPLHTYARRDSKFTIYCDVSYTTKVKDVLHYISENPMPIHGTSLSYTKSSPHELPEVIRDFRPEDVLEDGMAESDFSSVVFALLLLGCSALDEAHAIITPLSWHSYTDFGGKPIYNSPARKEAELCHALLHLREGENIGQEFGNGFNNAGFWFNQVIRAGGHSTDADIMQFATSSAQGSAILEAHMAKHGGSWNPKQFTFLCQRAVAEEDAEVLDFCVEVLNKMWRIMLDHCYEQASAEKVQK